MIKSRKQLRGVTALLGLEYRGKAAFIFACFQRQTVLYFEQRPSTRCSSNPRIPCGLCRRLYFLLQKTLPGFLWKVRECLRLLNFMPCYFATSSAARASICASAAALGGVQVRPVALLYQRVDILETAVGVVDRLAPFVRLLAVQHGHDQVVREQSTGTDILVHRLDLGRETFLKVVPQHATLTVPDV